MTLVRFKDDLCQVLGGAVPLQQERIFGKYDFLPQRLKEITKNLTMSHFKNYWAHETLEILKIQKTPLYISCFFVIFVGE